MAVTPLSAAWRAMESEISASGEPSSTPGRI